MQTENNPLPMSRRWHTTAALSWLQIILQERFGHIFVLKPQEDGCHLALQVPGDERYITLALDGYTFARADSELSCSYWNAAVEGWNTALKSTLHAPGVSTLPSRLIERTAQGWHIHYDILGMAYWMLTRQEEVERTDLDVHGRFSATSSHAFKHAYLDRPIVDEWLYVLGQVIKATWPAFEPKGHGFRMRVSHDVDQPSLYAFKSWGQIARIMAGHLIKRRNFKAFIQAPHIKLNSSMKINDADPFNTFDWIMHQSELCGLKSAFYFICGHTSPYDADYKIEDKRIMSLINKIHQRGHEIGLHPSYGSYMSPDMVHREAELLRRICDSQGIKQNEWGGRMHYLRWKYPDTIRALVGAGMDYDASLGYADVPGFRCGTCFDYPAFDLLKDEILKIRIRPLILMESTLMGEAYLGLGSADEVFDVAVRIKEVCRNMKGVFGMLWHNSTLIFPEHRSLYSKILSA